MAREYEGQSVHYTSGMGNEYFDWRDAQHDTARDLAEKFVERFPDLASAGKGQGWEYVGWFVEMLGVAEDPGDE